MSPEHSLVLATYGLVIVTMLLVVATAIPAYQRWSEFRQQHKVVAGQVIPDMNILLSRLDGGVTTLIGKTQLSEDDATTVHKWLREEGEMTAALIDHAYRVSLAFANELYILRHLLTQASIEVQRIIHTYANESGESLHDLHRDATTRLCRLYQAGSITLREAELLLPRENRQIDGMSFWDRFYQKSRDREIEAEKMLVDKLRESID
jgi:hypothetical protein